MSRKLASVVEIDKCEPIPDTERLSVATMNGKGWKVVTARDEFKSGDLAVYFEIDSYLPADDERYAFLRERCLKKFVSKSGQVLQEGLRIRTCKLRGVISQGLLMPIKSFQEILERMVVSSSGKRYFTDGNEGTPFEDRQLLVGTDVTELLSVKHYDEIAEELRPACTGNPVSADAMGKFPSDYIPKTDQERIQNHIRYFTTKKGRRFEVTEKNDGSSVTMFYSKTVDEEQPFGVCSRNLRLKPTKENGEVPLPWKMADKYGVEAKIKAANESCGCELAFQGELVGPGVNGNRDLYKDWEWHVFNVWNITEQRYLLPSEARFICKSVGLEYVPVILVDFDVFEAFHTMDDLLKFSEGKTAAGNEREGLVFKSEDYPYVSFKAVSNRYLLKGQKD